ncbi:MAG TPA: dihydrolipoamide acetyltransferase family protein [Candidatus Sulfotelmatobacter sp.]|nr:dihydrolipoamide acetyltransferase family protein [Candidatus Sulfotelmatobacter sp.]
MAFSVVMPALEMAQETGKLLAWRKKEGDRVVKGDPLLEIETDKAVVEVEAPADGVLAGIRAAEGSEIPVGQTIAWIVAPGEKPPAEGEANSVLPARASSSAKVALVAEMPAPAERSPRSLKISPKARRLAKELDVDVATLHGSGPGGEILASDVQAAAKSHVATPSAPSAAERSDKLEVPTSIGRIMAERTTQSWTTVPHFFVTRDVDAGALNEYREVLVKETESRHGIRITHTDLLVAIVARVLGKHPRLNASWTPEGIRIHDHVNMGIAIAVNDGVVAAVILDAHKKSVVEIAKQHKQIAERARTGRLHPSDISGATFTISNLGMYRVDTFSAIITPPQAAILAVGAIVDRVVAIDGKPAVRPMVNLTLSCDHRVADGARAAQFLGDLADALRDPAQLVTA